MILSGDTSSLIKIFVEEFTFLRREVESGLDLSQELKPAFFRVLFEEFGKCFDCFFELISRALGWGSHIVERVEVDIYRSAQGFKITPARGGSVRIVW